VNVHAKSRLIPETSTGTPVRDRGQAGACPDRTRAIPCTVRVVNIDGEDQGAAVAGVERKWEPRWEPRGRTTSRFSGRARTTKDPAQVMDWSESGRTPTPESTDLLLAVR
jgi:hypothetical protein